MTHGWQRGPTDIARRRSYRRLGNNSRVGVSAVHFVCSVPLAWFGFHWRERNALRRIEKLGTVTSWNFSHDHGGLVAVTLAPTKGDLCEKDLELLAGIKGLTLRGPMVTDEWLCNLKRASDVRFLDLSETSTGDSGLSCLAAMPDLVSLDLRNTAITDAGLKHLACLADLKSLQRSGTRITDAGLKDLLVLDHLGGLGLHNTAVTAEGVEQYRKATKHKDINIGYGPDPPATARR